MLDLSAAGDLALFSNLIDDDVCQEGWHLNPNELVNQCRLHMQMKISVDNIFRYRQIPFSSLKFTLISITIMGLVTVEKK